MSSASSINTQAPSTASQVFNPSSALNQSDFLKLLVTQMTSQDPLNPQSDTAFAAELAQFSALQQSQTTANDMQGLQANSLIGRTVTVTSSTNTNQSTTGVINSIDISSGTPEIVINGTSYNMSQIQTIAPTATTPAATTPAPTSP